MHIYTSTNERTRNARKHIPITDTIEKEYNNTWQKHDNTNWNVEIWKNNNTECRRF